MKTFTSLLVFLFFSLSGLDAQTITFRFANRVVTATSVSFDVTLESNTPFELRSGLVYINYNTAAFGTSAFTAGRVTVTQPAGSVLAQGWYGSFVSNQNADNRFAFSWQQVLSSGYFTDNITSSAAVLFRIEMDFAPGGSGQPDEICFESGEVFDDQTFTACGPHTAPPPFPQFDLADCTNFPGIQLLNDNFDCSFAALPVELSRFEARAVDNKKVRLDWQTQSERNNDHFVVERSADGVRFGSIEKVQGAGTFDGTVDYGTFDEQPYPSINYYRLKQVDFDGSFEYSDIRSVKIEGGEIQVSVYPNPASQVANVQLPEGFGTASLKVVDMSGRLVYEKELESNGLSHRVDVRDWRSGTYVMRLRLDGQVFVHKISVVRD